MARGGGLHPPYTCSRPSSRHHCVAPNLCPRRSVAGWSHAIGRRRRRTRVRSTTIMLCANSLSPMMRRICCIRAVTSGSFQPPPRNRISLGSLRSGKRQQSWIIQIGGNHGSRFLPRACQDFGIRGAIETHGRGVNGVVSLGCEPLRQGRRQRHIDEKFHRAKSTVSSSASKAAYCKASSMSSGSR
jgi:hypothetical protein